MSKVTIESEEDTIPIPYTRDKKMLVENHPLSYLISNKRQELIAHPLITALYNDKWNRLGFYVYYINLIIYMIFMCLLNAYALSIPPPYSYATNVASDACPQGSVALKNETGDLWTDADGLKCYALPSESL